MAKAILLVNDNAVTHPEFSFLFQNWCFQPLPCNDLKVPCTEKKKKDRLYIYVLLHAIRSEDIFELSTHFIIWKTRPEATCVLPLNHRRT